MITVRFKTSCAAVHMCHFLSLEESQMTKKLKGRKRKPQYTSKNRKPKFYDHFQFSD